MLPTILLGGVLALGQPPAPNGPPAYSPQVVPQSGQPVWPVGVGAPTPVPPAWTWAPAVRTAGPPEKAGDAAKGMTEGNGKDAKENKKDDKDKKDEPEKKDNPNGYNPALKPRSDEGGGFYHRLYREYYKQFFPDPNAPAEDEPEPPRRSPPSPWSSPPFPGSEYQGYPLIGVPYSTNVYPFMGAVYGGPYGQEIKDSRIKFEGWVTTFGDWSTSKQSNVPSSYWITPNSVGLDQMVFRLQREADTVQTDHVDWGFRSIALYGQDYRYTTAGGWGSDQLLRHNQLDGWDPVEQYVNVYVPGFLGGTDIRVGRWIACPDIEAQYSVDNYLGSHSILFTYDTYTQTGVMVTQRLNSQWIIQGVIHAGTDMAPWYKGATPTGAAGFRWVSESNNDAFYTWLNAINAAEFRHFQQYGQPLGHDNFNYFVTTWEHRFSEWVHTKTEAYIMWQRNAEVGGTPSAGPVKPYGGGGGDGTLLPGQSIAWGVLNYTMFKLSNRDYFTVRNEIYDDERGMRTGYSGRYSSHTIGISHQFNDVLMWRPEIGYYRNWNNPAFDNGTRRGMVLYGFDLTYRF